MWIAELEAAKGFWLGIAKPGRIGQWAGLNLDLRNRIGRWSRLFKNAGQCGQGRVHEATRWPRFERRILQVPPLSQLAVQYGVISHCGAVCFGYADGPVKCVAKARQSS